MAMKKSGKIIGNSFVAKSNGETEKYILKNKYSTRNRVVSEDYEETYTHITRVAYDLNGNRAGVLKSGTTGMSFFLDTNQ